MHNDSGSILLVTSTFPISKEDGIPRFVYDLAHGLGSHFDRIEVLAPDAPGAHKTETLQGMHVRRHSYAYPRGLQKLCYGSGIPSNLRNNPLLWLLVPSFLISQILSIRDGLSRNDNCIVNAHWLIPQGLCAAIAHTIKPFPIVLQVHAAGLYTLNRLPRFLGKPITRFICRHTNKIICTSNYVRNMLNDLLGYDSHADTISTGVHTELFMEARSDCSEPRILFFGRFVEKKGLPYLLKAMRIVKNTIPEAKLVIAGYGAMENELHQLHSDLNLGGSVEFIGKKTHKELIDVMKNIKVIAIPSIIDSKGETEGMPTVVLESLAAGKRTVGSNVDGIPDLIKHEENGWLCEPKNVNDLADKLLIALRDQGPEIVDNAIKSVENYSWKRICERYADIFSNIQSRSE